MGYKTDSDAMTGHGGSSEAPADGGPVFRVGYMIQTVVGSRAELDEIHRRENCDVLGVVVDGVAVTIVGSCLTCKGLILAGETHYLYSEGDRERVCLGCLEADEGFIFAVRNPFVTSEEAVGEEKVGGWVADPTGRLFNFGDLCDSDWSWDVARDFVKEFSTQSAPFGVYVVRVDLGLPVAGSAWLVWTVGSCGGSRRDACGPGEGIDLVDARCVPGGGCGSCSERAECSFLASEAAEAAGLPSKMEVRCDE